MARLHRSAAIQADNMDKRTWWNRSGSGSEKERRSHALVACCRLGCCCSVPPVAQHSF